MQRRVAKEDYISVLGYTDILALSGSRVDIKTECNWATEMKEHIKELHFKTIFGKHNIE